MIVNNHPWLKERLGAVPQTCFPLSQGAENRVYGIRYGDGGDYVLKQYRFFKRAQVQQVAAVLDELNQTAEWSGSPATVTLPSVWRDINGEAVHPIDGLPALLQSRLAGETRSVCTPLTARHMGKALALFHQRTYLLGRGTANWRDRHWLVRTARAVSPYVSAGQRQLLNKAVASLKRYPWPDLPEALIHGDPFRDNVLWLNGRIHGFVDLDYACRAPCLFDIAAAAFDWCRPRGCWDPVCLQALLSAYHRQRALTPPEKAAWPAILRWVALRFWLSRLESVYLCELSDFNRDPGECERWLAETMVSDRALLRLWRI